MRRAAMMLALLLLGGCASRYVSPDPDNPKQTCEHTLEGGAPKTVCY